MVAHLGGWRRSSPGATGAPGSRTGRRRRHGQLAPAAMAMSNRPRRPSRSAPRPVMAAARAAFRWPAAASAASARLAAPPGRCGGRERAHPCAPGAGRLRRRPSRGARCARARPLPDHSRGRRMRRPRPSRCVPHRRGTRRHLSLMSPCEQRRECRAARRDGGAGPPRGLRTRGCWEGKGAISGHGTALDGRKRTRSRRRGGCRLSLQCASGSDSLWELPRAPCVCSWSGKLTQAIAP